MHHSQDSTDIDALKPGSPPSLLHPTEGRQVEGCLALGQSEQSSNHNTSGDSSQNTSGDSSQNTSGEGQLPSTSDTQKSGPVIYLGAWGAQGKREHMEDRYALAPFFLPKVLKGITDCDQRDLPPDLRDVVESRANACYCAVFDGHSAAQAADTAAERMHKVLAAEIGHCRLSDGEGDPIIGCIKRTFGIVDFEIIVVANREGKSYGSTAVMALQLGNALYVAHAGDSEAVLERDGEAMRVAAAHKPDDPQELRRIEAKGGTVIVDQRRIKSPTLARGALNMSRSLGDPAWKQPRRLVSCEPSVMHLNLRRGDTALILASDGLWDVMKPAEVTETVGQVLNAGNATLKAAAVGESVSSLARTAARALVERALHCGSHDNVTAVVGLIRWQE